MKRKHLTETPVCPHERLVIISNTTGLSFALKGLGRSQQLLLLSFIYSYFIYLHYQIPLKTHLLVFTVISWSKLLVNTFYSSLGSTLLFIESTMIHPLYLWVINQHMQITNQHKEIFIRICAHNMIVSWKILLKWLWGKKQKFWGRYHGLGIFSFSNEGRHYIPFLKDFIYMIEIHLEIYS
jgi:hypothetical protein